MKTACRSCGCSCIALGSSSSARHVRCPQCGSMNVIAGATDVAISGREASILLSLTRIESTTRARRTLILREDGTTELRAGDRGEELLVKGHAARATVSSWHTLRRSRALEGLQGPSASASCEYELHIDDARHAWSGVPSAPDAARVWSMLAGLWRTVAQTPF